MALEGERVSNCTIPCVLKGNGIGNDTKFTSHGKEVIFDLDG